MSIPLLMSFCFSLNTVSDPNCYTNDNGTLYITCGDSIVATETSKYLTKEIVTVNITGQIKTIEDEAFSGFGKLANFVVASNVTSLTTLGASIFNGTVIKTLSLPSTIQTIKINTFSGLSIDTLTIPLLSQDFDKSPFETISTLTKATLIDPTGDVNKIAEYLFHGCVNLKSIDVQASKVSAIGQQAFAGCTQLYDVNFRYNSTITSIGRAAFSGCSKLTAININMNGDLSKDFDFTIEDDAFEGCTSVSSIHIGSGNLVISNTTLLGMPNVVGIQFRNKNLTLNENALASFPSLRGLTIECGAVVINNKGLYNLTTIKSLIIDVASDIIYETSEEEHFSQITSIIFKGNDIKLDNHAFESCPQLYSLFVSCNSFTLGTATFSDSNLYSIRIAAKQPTTVSQANFGSSTQIKYFKFEGPQLNITKSTFENQHQLSEVIINAQNMYLDDYGFYSCSSLSVFIFPGNFMHVGSYAFAKCSHITSFTVHTNAADCLGVEAFGENENLEKFALVLSSGKPQIPANLFKGCKKLQEFICQQEITEIPDGMFEDCINFTKFTAKITEITAIGHRAFYNCVNLATLPNFDKLTTVGNYSFYNCQKLQSFTANSQVERIGNECFKGCSSLTTFTVDAEVGEIGIESFKDCKALTTFKVKGLNTISNYSFVGCDSLVEFNADYPIKVIDFGAFSNLKNLKTFTCTNEIERIEKEVFMGCENLEKVDIKNVKHTCCRAFKSCTALKEFTSPIESMCDELFSGCINLEKFVPSPDLKKIGHSCFEFCNKLQTFDFSNVEVIGDRAFYSCQALTSFVSGEKISVGSFAFYQCSALETVTINAANTFFNTSCFASCMNLKSFKVVPTNEVSLGEAMFKDCKSLNEFVAVVSSVEDEAFMDCIVLSNFDAFKHVSKIGENAFRNSAIASVVIDSQSTTIHAGAFEGCSQLTDVMIASEAVFGRNAFKNCVKLEKFVYCGSQTNNGTIFEGCEKLSSVSVKHGFGSKTFFMKDAKESDLCGNDSQHGKTTAAKVALAVTVLAAIAVVVGFVVYFIFKKKRPNVKNLDSNMLLSNDASSQFLADT